MIPAVKSVLELKECPRALVIKSVLNNWTEPNKLCWEDRTYRQGSRQGRIHGSVVLRPLRRGTQKPLCTLYVGGALLMTLSTVQSKLTAGWPAGCDGGPDSLVAK